METQVSQSRTPNSRSTAANFCVSTPRRRSGRRRTQSDTYRKVALTRSASQALRIQKPLLASRSYSLRNKKFMLELLADSGLSNSTNIQDQENSIEKITPTLGDAPPSAKSIGDRKIVGTNGKVKASSIKLNLLKSKNA